MPLWATWGPLAQEVQRERLSTTDTIPAATPRVAEFVRILPSALHNKATGWRQKSYDFCYPPQVCPPQAWSAVAIPASSSHPVGEQTSSDDT